MQITAEIESQVNTLIANRKSIRAFSPQPISPDMVDSLFEAARWAPSSMNEQPWRYIYAHREQTVLWDKIFDGLEKSNQIWVKEAGLLIVSFYKKAFTRNDKPNGFAKHDLGSANGFLALQAVDLGLQAHQMGGYKPELIRDNLQIPEEFELGSVIAVGYPGSLDILSDELRKRELEPRVRKVKDEFVFNKAY